MALARLVALGSTLLLCQGSLAAFSPPKRILVVSDDGYPPYLFRTDSGKLQGIIVDKWELWSRKTGIPVRVDGMEWIKAQDSVRSGSGDVIETLAYTEARAKLYEFSAPYADVDARVFFHRSIGGINNDVASMRGFTIGAKDGSACAAWLEERGIRTLRRFPTSDALVEAAHARDVPLFCLDSPTAQYFLFKLNLTEEFRQTAPLYSTRFHWAVRNGQTELRDFIQRGFGQVTADELKDIDARWLGSPLPLSIAARYWTYLAFAAAGILAFSALLIVWNRALSLRVSAKTAELRSALGSLQVHSDKVRDLYDNAPCGYHSLDGDGIIVEINDTELQWLGYSRGEVIGKLRFTDLLTDEGRRKFRENFERFKEQGSMRDMEYELVRKGGTRMSALVSASLVRDADGSYLMSRATLYDVTEWNQAVLALKESEERFGLMFQHSPNAIMVTSVEDGRVIDANEGLLRIVGRARGNVIGRTTAELGFWRDAEERAAALDLEAMARGSIGRYQRVIHTPAGEQRDMLVSATRIELQGEAVLLSMIEDVTERRRAERLLEESERRLAKVIEASPESITITTLDSGTFIETNPACERLYGYKREELIGRSALDLGFWPDPEERQRFVGDLERNGVVDAREVQMRRKDGELRELLASGALIEIEGRRLMVFQAIDVTERRRAARLLRESEARLARIIEASPEAITISGVEDGAFIEVNPATERLGGYAHEEMIGRSALDLGLWPDPEERQRLIADLQRNEAVYGREIRLRRKDGEILDILASAALIDVGGRKLILFQGIDITERKNAEKALRAHEELLRELSAHHDSVREEERARIAREIHDEMGQALTALRMDLSVLGLESGKAAPRVAEQVRELKARVDNIIHLVRNVATALRPAALDLGILAGVEWLVDEFQKRSGIRCRVEVENDPIDLPEDRGIVLFRILQESLTNISRHANARNVEISLRRDATHVRLEVKDDGQGFDPASIQNKKTFGLLGIRERAIMLHGDLSITSAPGRGTQVSLSIPV